MRMLKGEKTLSAQCSMLSARCAGSTELLPVNSGWGGKLYVREGLKEGSFVGSMSERGL